MFDQLNLKVKDTVFEPDSYGKTVNVKESDRKHPLYKVFLFLEGADLPYVRSVTYHLHRTFPNPIRTVRRTASNDNCQLVIWTWGLFEVEVKIEYKSGRIYKISHKLAYDREFNDPGIKFIDS